MVILYEHPLSPYAQKVKIALAEKGIPFESRLPDLFAGGDPGFAAVNPRAEVPALVDGDANIFDSTIILEYLEEKWPRPPLMPASPAERARARMIEELCDTYYEAINWGVFEIRAFGRADGELADRLLQKAGQQIDGANRYLDAQLGSRPFFSGEAFGRADLSAVPVVHAAAAFIGRPPAAGSSLEVWLERVRARPSVAAVFEAALGSMTGLETLPQLVAAGALRREYRDHRLEWMLRSGGVEIVLDGMRKNNIRFSHELG